MKKLFVLVLLNYFFISHTSAQLGAAKETFTHADTLRGSPNPNRTWWNVLRYDIDIKPDYTSKTIEGICTITFKIISNGNYLQIDLQQPLIIDSAFVYISNNELISSWENFKRDGNAYLIPFSNQDKIQNQIHKTELTSLPTCRLKIYYHGSPVEAKRPPWDGGWIWKKDSLGRPWMSVACEGNGASVWYPCKDYLGDEPDSGASLTITVPDTLVVVGNGRLKSESSKDGLATYIWEVKNPINNYNIVPYIGNYVNFTDTFMGEKGKLDLSYWVLDYNLARARKQFAQVKPMLRAFEYWFGPYPFYEDGYKLVEAPHLGMEHQSAIAYGNSFENGYRGTDLSGSGWGLKWDFIIVHESGHEWFGNNITSKDLADMWLHESFANYGETLFTEYYYGKDAGNAYNYGIRTRILNDKPVTGPYGVNKEGSRDMYYKGGNMLQTIRHAIDNDEKWRQILRGLNSNFYHQTVTAKQVEDYISSASGIDFSKVFDQYLHSIQIPVLDYFYSDHGKTLSYRWDSCVAGFNMPLVLHKKNETLRLLPTQNWQKLSISNTRSNIFDTAFIDRNYYIRRKKVTAE